MRSRNIIPVVLGGIAALALGLTGCQSSGGVPTPTSTATSGADNTVQITPELIAAAQKEGTVSIRFGDPQAQMDALVADFQKTYPGIQVVQDRNAGAAGGQKTIQEAQSGVKQIDAFEGTDYPTMEQLAQQGYVLDLQPPNATDFPAAMTFGPGFYAANAVQEVVAYNTNLVDSSKVSVLQDWNQDATAGGLGQLGVFSLTLSTGIGPFLYANKEIGPDWIKQVAASKPVVSDASASARDALVAGQSAVTLGQWDAVMDQLVAQGAPVAYVYPNPSPSWGGGYWGVLADAPHPNAARLFWAYMLSKQACDTVAAPPLYVKCTLLNYTDNRVPKLPDGSTPSWFSSVQFTKDYPMPIDIWNDSQDIRDQWDSLQ